MASAANEHNSPYLRIVLLGVCGAGKSSIANAILGREAFEESRTRESEIQRGRVEDKNISIIDTPGLFNTHLTDEELEKQMMKSLDLCSPGPHAFLLIINLENFRDDQKNIVQKILEHFGPQALKFTMVLFIGREKLSRRALSQIIESEETQKILNYFEGRFSVINSKHECGTNHITMLLKSVDDMIRSNRGQNYSNETYLENMRKHREQKQELFKVEKERMKLEEESKRDVNMKKNQEERETPKQKEGYQEEEIKFKTEEDQVKDHSERRQVDVRKKTRNLKDKDAAVQEDLWKQMESRRVRERQRWALERGRSSGNPSRQADLRIMILGKIKSGKSASANTILGRDAFNTGAVAAALSSNKQEAVVSGRNISIIDAPSILDAPLYKYLPNNLKRDIDKSLDMCAPGPHVFLLVIKLNGRHTEDEKNTVKWFLENFGEKAVRHTFVLFTHVDLLVGESLDQYIRKSPDLQILIDSCSGRFHSFNNQHRNNRNQVTELLEKIDQLVKDNSGQHYENEKSQKMKQDKNLETTERDSVHRESDELLELMTRLYLSEMVVGLSEARAEVQNSLSNQGLRIVLLGLLGEGKSSTGNTILGRDAFGAGLLTSTITCQKQTVVLSGRTISIVDTPGIQLDDSLATDNQNLSEIEKSLELSVPGPHVFLLVFSVLRSTLKSRNPVKRLRQIIKKDALNHTIIVFTFSDSSVSTYMKSLIDSGDCKYHLIDNMDRNNRVQVTELLEKMDKLVRRNGGMHYTKPNILNTQDTGTCDIQ